MEKVSLKVIEKAYPSSKEHLYICFHGRKIQLCAKKNHAKPHHKASALKILRSIKKQEKELCYLTGENLRSVRCCLENVVEKKKKRSFIITLLSRAHNIFTFNGFLTSHELSRRLLKKLNERSQEALEKKLPQKINLYPKIPKEEFIHNFVVEFVKDLHFSLPKKPLIEALYKEMDRRGFPFIRNHLDEIEQQAFYAYIKEKVNNFKKGREEGDPQNFVTNLNYSIPKHFPNLQLTPTQISRSILDNMFEPLEKKVREFVNQFLEPYISQTITPQNEPKNRLSLMDRLQQAFPNIHYERLEEIALEAYFQEAIHGMEIIHNKNNYDNQPQDGLDEKPKKQKKPKYTLIFTPEIRDTIFFALKLALPKDFPETTITDFKILERMDSAIIKFRREKINGFQKVFQDFIDIEIMEMETLNKKEYTNSFYPNECDYIFEKTEQDFALYECRQDKNERTFYIPLIKIGNDYYRAPYIQTRSQIFAKISSDFKESFYNPELKNLGIKLYSRVNNTFIYYCVDETGRLCQIHQSQVDQLLQLVERIDYSSTILGAAEFYYCFPPQNLTFEIKSILNLNKDEVPSVFEGNL